MDLPGPRTLGASTKSASQLHELFPTPVSSLRGLVSPAHAANLARVFSQATPVANTRSAGLAHSSLLQPGQSEEVDALAKALLPHVCDFGTLLLGEARPWSIKEMWVNVMKPGGQQSVHNHANCLVSGIVYLTPTQGHTQTVFVKSVGGLDYKLSNEHAGTQQTPFNAQRWRAPEALPGDAVLFPSYLLHEVPPSQGPLRITVAFNAIPDRLDAWGYRLALSA